MLNVSSEAKKKDNSIKCPDIHLPRSQFVPLQNPNETQENTSINDSNYIPKLRIVHISDTHCKHNRIFIPDGDILIHSGFLVFCTFFAPAFFSLFFTLQSHDN